MIRNIINLKAIILYFGLILCLIAGMPTPAYGSSSYPVKEESYVLVINSYVDGERWSGNLLNMISKFATPEEYTLRIDHISVMLVDTPEKLKEKQEVFFEANKKKPDGIIYLGVNGWAFMRDKIREKWGDIPTLVCSETGEMAENECYFNQRHSSDRVIPLQEAVKGYNATGLVIPYYVKGSIDLVKELIPGLKRLISYPTDVMFPHGSGMRWRNIWKLLSLRGKWIFIRRVLAPWIVYWRFCRRKIRIERQP